LEEEVEIKEEETAAAVVVVVAVAAADGTNNNRGDLGVTLLSYVVVPNTLTAVAADCCKS